VAFDFFDHTGDIGVTLSGPTLAEIFSSAVAAFAEAVTDTLSVKEEMEVPLRLEAEALDLLLGDWLREALHLFDGRQVLVKSGQADVKAVGGVWRLEGTLRGERFDASCHRIKVLIKAVTYHGLEVVETNEGWRATVVFDI
jgi:SHS2 domain-containing protein